MTVNLTETNGCENVDLSGVATHYVRVHFNETDAGHLSGPFTLVGARQAAIVALSRSNVIKATIEPMS